MRLFHIINSWAGRSDWLDNALRLFYVGAVPLLLTALAALLILAPSHNSPFAPYTSRLRLTKASLVALALCALMMPLVALFQTYVLAGTPISTRPFVTNWVHILVLEPNDNSFPCFEVMFAAAAAMLLWAYKPSFGILGWLAVILLGFSRTFCGMNYLADSIAGAVLGGALSTLTLAAWRIPLQWPHRPTYALPEGIIRPQAAISTMTLAGLIGFAVFSLNTSPAHGAKWRNFWIGIPAIANTENGKGTKKPHSSIQEGEGGALADANSSAMVLPGQPLLSSRATRLDGHLPQAEKHLKTALTILKRPHRLVGVNVAEVRAGNSGYRCAAIRFEVKAIGPQERRLVAETAAQFTKRAFHADAQLQHLDIIGVRQDDGEQPVFTASIARRDLILRNKPAWVNWSGLDGGAWLRARSALYIDSKTLPASTQPATGGQP